MLKVAYKKTTGTANFSLFRRGVKRKMLSDLEYGVLEATFEGEKKAAATKRQVLKDLDLFVMDNSLRESTVGQLKGHTLEDKWAILEEIKKCGFKNIIVAAFSHMPRVDDSFVDELTKKENDLSCFFAFSEVGKLDDPEYIPVGLAKMKKYGLKNPIIEIDLANQKSSNFTQEMCSLLQKRFGWSYENLDPSAKILVNLRDFPFALESQPRSTFEIVKFLATLPTGSRPFGLMYEEPTGKHLPEVLAGWTKAIRKCMDNNGWKDGVLLVHIHKKWGYADVAQADCLAAGANGIWASICEEGAGLGHASSIVTIMNLVRMGNEKVKSAYNCKYLRDAAVNVTKITTGLSAYPKQILYGERALDMAFDFPGIASGHSGSHDLDVAEFFGLEAPKRISTLASTHMILERLRNLFGENEQFTEEIATNMKAKMIEDLKANRKEEYMSHVGLALLFDRAGGKLTAEMRDVIEKAEVSREAHKALLAEVKATWDEWDLREEVQGDEALEFFSFYNAFMSPYFGCYECDIAKKALQAIDMDTDGTIDWSEFCVYLKWALNEYPEIATVKDLLNTAFTKGIIPAMYDELTNKAKTE